MKKKGRPLCRPFLWVKLSCHTADVALWQAGFLM